MKSNLLLFIILIFLFSSCAIMEEDESDGSEVSTDISMIYDSDIIHSDLIEENSEESDQKNKGMLSQNDDEFLFDEEVVTENKNNDQSSNQTNNTEGSNSLMSDSLDEFEEPVTPKSTQSSVKDSDNIERNNVSDLDANDYSQSSNVSNQETSDANEFQTSEDNEGQFSEVIDLSENKSQLENLKDDYKSVDELFAEMPSAKSKPEKKSRQLARIIDLQFRAFQNLSIFIIESNIPLNFSTKYDERFRQFVLDINDVILPKNMQRPFDTKDMPGDVSFIDIFVPKKSRSARFVFQLRNGLNQPVVESDGKIIRVLVKNDSLLSEKIQDGGEDNDLQNLDNFSALFGKGSEFKGRKISIEVDDLDIKDLLRLIADEAGINIVTSDEVKGNVSLKLKEVPWDQALLMILRTKKLGFIRVGNVLRVAPLTDLKTEEEELFKLEQNRKLSQKPIIKTIPLNYSKVEDIERQVKPLLTPKGNVVVDTRTTSVVVSDIPENLEFVEKFIKKMDTPPQQVLIEARVVEASDNFENRFGIQWNMGRTASLGNLRISPQLSISPGLPGAGTFGLNFRLGTLDFVGDLTTRLRLFEAQGLVKVISSPRILTLHNETAEITQVTEIPIITSNVLPTGAAQPIVNFKPVQLKLNVTPQVTNDGAVVLRVDLSREIAGPVADQETGARPVFTRSAKTRVLVKNSQTIVIGGIYQNDTSEREERVPGLGKLPILGWLFKNKTYDSNRQELLIFLTPKILSSLNNMYQSEKYKDLNFEPTNGDSYTEDSEQFDF